MALFCIASSATYVFNDLRDIEADRSHPTKRYSRPLASGELAVSTAWIMLAGLIAVLLAGFAFDVRTTGITVLYLVVNVAYTLRLKEVPVVDVFVIATGFVLRVWAGAVAISVALSSWMFITTLCLALHLASIKRRDELAAGGTGRAVLGSYSVNLLDRFAERAAIAALVFYGLFVIEVRPALAPTVPIVLFGLYRYSFVVSRDGGGESPTDALWRDVPLMITIAAWGGLCAFLLWSS